MSWVFAGKRIVTLLDGITLARIEFASLEHVVYDLGSLRLAGKSLDLMDPAFAWAANVSLDSSGRAVLESGGRRFPFGQGRVTASIDGVPTFEFGKDPGDEASLIVEQSRLAWPTPFETNFMTGYVPSKKRNVYFGCVGAS